MSNLLNILLISFSISITLTYLLIKFQKKYSISQFIRNDGPSSHLSKKGTPTFGGVAFIIAQLLTLSPFYSYPAVNFYMKTLSLFFLIGFLDDVIKIAKIKNGISAKTKLFLQIIISSFLVFSAPSYFGTAAYTFLVLPIAGIIYTPLIFNYFLNLIAFVGSSNSINLTDGLDGLLSSILIGFWTVLFSSLIIFNIPNTDLYFLSIVNIGSLLGFLIFNKYPAKIFMGDCGSLALGASFCSISLYYHSTLLLIGFMFIPVIEALSVILQVGSFRIYKRKIFKMAPIHHHFEQEGYHEKNISLSFMLINSAAATLTIYLLSKTLFE